MEPAIAEVNFLPRTHGEFGRFFLVGGTGFCVDAAFLALLHHLLGLDVVPARLISFVIAATVTWYLNRRYTFKLRAAQRTRDEWSRYLVVNGLGAVLNFTIFIWLLSAFPYLAPYPLLILAIASAVALIFNFLGSKYLVFHKVQV